MKNIGVVASVSVGTIVGVIVSVIVVAMIRFSARASHTYT